MKSLWVAPCTCLGDDELSGLPTFALFELQITLELCGMLAFLGRKVLQPPKFGK